MNAPQAKNFQIFLFKLLMDARWDNLPLRNRPPPWKWKFSDLPLKFKTSKFQLPPNTSGGDVRTMIFNGLIYKQIDGVAMDSTLQPFRIKEILS